MSWHLDRYINTKGFTLLELLVTLAVAGILSTLAISAFKNSIAQNRITTELTQLKNDFVFAGTEALRTGLPVTVCSTNDGSTCSQSTTWSTGWIVFDDPNAALQTGSNTVIVRKQSSFTDGDNITADNSINTVAYNRQGYVNNIATSISTVTFTDQAASPSTSTTQCLTMTFLGQLGFESSGQGNCP